MVTASGARARWIVRMRSSASGAFQHPASATVAPDNFGGGVRRPTLDPSRVRGGERAEVLVERLRDSRSAEVVFLSHCVLNENTRYLGGACRRGCVRELVDACLDQGLGIVQLPCPEERAWGGVLKRRMLRLYGVSHRSALADAVLARLVPLMVAYTRWVYRRLAKRVVSQIADYRAAGFAVRAVVGIDGSPSCGVGRTLDIGGALRYMARLEPAAASVTLQNEIVRDHVRPGRGLFIEALQRELARRNVRGVPVLAHDLVDELDGGHASGALFVNRAAATHLAEVGASSARSAHG